MSTSTCRTNTIRQAAGPLACGMVFLGMVAPALAQEPSDRPALETALVYKADVMASRSDGGGVAGRFLDNLELAADMDLDRSLRWSGARLHMDVLSNSGGKPNDVAATLQGVDNIEVARP